MAWLQIVLASHYARDVEFGKTLLALSALAAEVGELPSHISDVDLSADSATAHYASALGAVAQRFGVDRLPDGPQIIHVWCRERVKLGAQWSPGDFPKGITGWGELPKLPTVLTGLTGAEWDPIRESWPAARARLRTRVDEELERVASEAERAGLVFHDSKPNLLTRDITWLYWRLRFRLSYATIAERAGLQGEDASDRNPAERVRRAVERAARAMGLDQTD